MQTVNGASLGNSANVVILNGGVLTSGGVDATLTRSVQLDTGGGGFAQSAFQVWTIPAAAFSLKDNGTRTLSMDCGTGSIIFNALYADQGGISSLTILGNANNSTTVTMGNSANSFTGNVSITGVLSIAKIGNQTDTTGYLGSSNVINLGSGTTSGGILYTGSTAETSDKLINLAGTTALGLIRMGQGANVLLKLTTDLSISGVGTKTFQLAPANGGTVGTLEFAGKISDGTGSVISLLIGQASNIGNVGTFIVSNTANSFTGGVTINHSTLSVPSIGNSGSPSALGTNATIAIGPTMDGNAAANPGLAQLIYTGAGESSNKLFNLINKDIKTIGTGAGTGGAVIDAGSGWLNFNNTASWTSTGAGIGSNWLTLRGSNAVTSSVIASLIIDNAGNSLNKTYIHKTGTGTWTLTNSSNSFSGDIAVTGGTLVATSIGNGATTGALGKSSNFVALGSGGTLQLTGSAETTDKVLSIIGNGSLDASGSGLIKFTANTISPGTASKTFTLTGTGSGELSGVIGTYTGGTQGVGAASTASATSLMLNSVDNLAIGTVLSGGGMAGTRTITAIDYLNRSVTIASTGIIVPAGSSLTTADSNGADIAITKNGTGTWTLSGTNTFNGVVAVNNGILSITNSNALGTTTGGTSVASGATLQLSGNLSVGTEALSLSGVGYAGQNGALVNVSGANTYGGQISLLADATISSDSGSLSLSSASTLNGGFNLTLTGASTSRNNTITSPIGTGSLTKTGAGIWILNGNNTYVGATNITNGTLLINGAPTGASTFSVTADATHNNVTLAGIGTVSATTVTVQGTDVTHVAVLRNGPADDINDGYLTINGNVNLNSFGQITIDILPTPTNPGSFYMVISGSLSMNTNSILNVHNLTGGALTEASYNLISNSGASGPGEFGFDSIRYNGLPTNFTNVGGTGYDLYTDGNYFYLIPGTPVPEPVSLVLLGLGGLMLLPGRKRQWA